MAPLACSLQCESSGLGPCFAGVYFPLGTGVPQGSWDTLLGEGGGGGGTGTAHCVATSVDMQSKVNGWEEVCGRPDALLSFDRNQL